MAKKILVVCIGNICRSPMAAALLQNGLPAGFEVSSAGIGALVGDPAHETSEELIKAKGLSLDDHVARQLDEKLLNASDIVLTMESKHTDWIENQWPQARGRVYRWGHWDEFDISDPYRRGHQAFQDSLVLIEKGLEKWLEKLGQLA